MEARAAGTAASLFYVLSVPLILLVLVALLTRCVLGAARARRSGSEVSIRHRALVVLPIAGFLMFGAGRASRAGRSGRLGQVGASSRVDRSRTLASHSRTPRRAIGS